MTIIRGGMDVTSLPFIYFPYLEIICASAGCVQKYTMHRLSESTVSAFFIFVQVVLYKLYTVRCSRMRELKRVMVIYLRRKLHHAMKTTDCHRPDTVKLTVKWTHLR